MQKIVCIFLLIFPFCLKAEQSVDELIHALEITAYWDQKLNERFATTFNHVLSTGYFTTHSAHMREEGEVGLGFANTPPYLNWNACFQPFFFLELSANYRLFSNCKDSSLSQYGFGNYADRGANFKIALVTPEQSFYNLPGLAFGIDDFMGSKKFITYFIVGSKIWIDYGLEISFGWGAGRYTNGPSRGFFGGGNWFPCSHCSNKWIKGFCLTAEYDPTNYTHFQTEPHPDGRFTHTPINFGAKYNLADVLELSASYMRGQVFAAAVSFHKNWGTIEGFFPKVDDPPPYSAPLDHHPLGCERQPNVMVDNLSYALDEQGFILRKAWLGSSTLWVRLINCRYRQEGCVRMRLQKLLAALIPSNIETIVVQLESNGLVCQQYVYNQKFLFRYINRCITAFECEIVSPREEGCIYPPAELVFHQNYDVCKARISPRLENFFGSVSGKYKYDLGVKLSMEGFLPSQWFYEITLSTTLFSDLNHMSDFDIFAPSQQPNVATDYVRYRQSHSLCWDRLYLQKNWNLQRAFFARLAGGYFQVNYAGVALEALWYPTQSTFAIGVQGAALKKRRFTGLGFQSILRHFEEFKPIFSSYSILAQYFLDFYLDIRELQISTKISIGQFLARDKGVRIELTRYFKNGIRFSGWVTLTDAHDQIHEKNYYDRGVALEIPFDFFYKCSSRRIWSYAMGAWLRDAGYTSWTGRPLFETVNQERRW